MISVLIPVYNYNVKPLVNAIHKQITETKVPFEIIIIDDCSTTTKYPAGFCEILEHTTLKVQTTNLGRERTRQKLAEAAIYTNLLFLDADVLPKHDAFILNYLNKIKDETLYEAIFGGICYRTEKNTQKKENLRLKYGLKYESVSVEEREKNKYLNIVSANFLVKKSIFIQLNKIMTSADYGFDILFASNLRKENISVSHINNEVYHMGLDTNLEFVKKSENALKTYYNLLVQNRIDLNENKLISAYTFLKKIHFTKFFNLIYTLFKDLFLKNLNSKKPSLMIFQIYRILFFCHLSQSQNND
jgi:glycosyltransferase involved in cell wall biosynthesis